MTEQAAAAPTADTQEATPTPATPAPSKYEQAKALLKGRGAPPAPAAPAPAATPAAPPKAAEDLDRARAQQAVLENQRKAMDARKRAEQAEAKLKELEVFTGSDRAALLKALKSKGVTIEDLAKAELEAPDDEDVPGETPTEKALRERLEAFERKEAEREASSVRAQNLDLVSKHLTASATQLPLLQSYGIAAETILKHCEKLYDETGEQPDVGAVAVAYQGQIMSELDQILSTDSALEAWLARPEVKNRALKILRAKNPSAGPASDEGANEQGTGASLANSSTAAASGAPRQARALTYSDRQAAALEQLRNRLK